MKLLNRSALSLVVCSLGLLVGCGEYREEEVEVGYRGEARMNPFLAAARLLERHDYTTEKSANIALLPDTTTAVVIPAESIPSYGGASRFQQWVLRGGHLIYIIDGASPTPQSIGDFMAGLGGEEVEHPLMEEFGLEVGRNSMDGNGEVIVSSGSLDVEMDSGFTVSVPGELAYGSWPDVVMDSQENARLISMQHGAGRLTVIADAEPIRNRFIGDRDHARLLVELVDLHYADTVMFIYGTGTSFWSMLLHYGWMPLLGLAILTLLWIWKNLPRFGPIIPHKTGGSMQFGEHLDMSGRFLWRHKAASALLAPLTTNLLRGFLKRHPHHTGSPDAHLDYFAENSELSREEIAEALQTMSVNDPASMTRIVKNLKHLHDTV